MKTQFNLTTSPDDLQRFKDQDELLALLKGFDGLEIMVLGEDERGILPKEKVIGLHMTSIPYWLDFWQGDMAACLREFDRLENIRAYYGGESREALLARWHRDWENAKAYEAEYVVFHVGHCSLAEALTNRYQHTDAQVIAATCDLLNQLLAEEKEGPWLLLENLWEPGLTLRDPAMVQTLLRGINYPRTGLMLDTGHLLHTNLSLRSQKEGLAYIHQVLDQLGDLCERIQGVHLHQSLSGREIKANMAHPPQLGATYPERAAQMFSYVFQIDRHWPFTCPGVRGLIERIKPRYLTYEFISRSKEEFQTMLRRQKRALAKKGC